MRDTRLNNSQSIETNGYSVFKWPHRGLTNSWDVWRDGMCIAEFATYAEAIDYAQEHAKNQALKEPS